MAKGRKTGGRNFKKGNSVGAKGRTPMSDKAKTFKALTKTKFIEIVSKYLDMSLPNIQEALISDTIPALDAIVLSIILKAIEEGDQRRLDSFVDRLVGKVPNVIEGKVKTTMTVSFSGKDKKL